jgi:Flp pilus assembly protein TadD
MKLASRRLEALGVGAACALVSLAIPSTALARSEEAISLANRAMAYQLGGDFAAAERDARRAIALDPSSPNPQFGLGVIFEGRGRAEDAEEPYRRAVAIDPGHAEAAGNLAKLLILRGASGEAIPLLRRALAARPGNEVCWTNLVLAYVAGGDLRAAREAAQDAARAGVTLDPGVIGMTVSP